MDQKTYTKEELVALIDRIGRNSGGKNIKSELWFYGELRSALPIKTLTDTNHGTV